MDKRAHKKRLNKLALAGYYISCEHHPVIITKIAASDNIYTDTVEGIDLITGEETSCSVFTCAPHALSEQEVENMLNVYSESGEKGLALTFGGFTEESYDEFYNIWVNHG